MNPAENYCNPCSQDWKYKDLQAQIDAARAARNQRQMAAKQKEKDDAKAKKQKEKDDAKAHGKGKGTGAGKAKPAKNTAADSAKRGTKGPRDGDDQDGPAPKRMGGQVDEGIEPMRSGRPLGRIPVFPKRDASPLAAEPSPVLRSIEQPDDASDEASEVGSTKSFISDSGYENKSIQNYDETSCEGTGDSDMSVFGDNENESQSAGEESGEDSGLDKSSSESSPYTTHDSSGSESGLESSSSSESEQELEPETGGGGSDIEGGGGSDDEPGTVDNGPENSGVEPSDEEPVSEASPSPFPSPYRAGGRFVGPKFPKAPRAKKSAPAPVPDNDDGLPPRCQGTAKTGHPCKRRGHFKKTPNCHDHED